VWGTDNVGKITANSDKFFYLKDHLGTIRVVLNASNNIVSANDYDPWGYPLDGRTYQSDNTDYKFTGKQRDTETGWDYFGARYYDARIGNWGSVDAKMEKNVSFSSYSYVLRNPLIYTDPKGEEWFYIWDEGGTSGEWKFYRNTPKMNVWNGKYDNNGEKIMEEQKGYSELLTFVGNKLTWLKENGGYISWSAVAGVLKNGKTQPELQSVRNIGPIPTGWWIVDPKKTLSKEKETNPIQKIIWDYEYDAWGYYKTPISPIGETQTYGRDGFTIHGGTEPGSKGCIDLTGSNDDFHKAFLENNKEMILHVDYSKIK